MRQLMRRLAPTTFDDIAAINASIDRPLSENVHNDYADRKNCAKSQLRHEVLEDVLSTTMADDLPRGHHARATTIAGFTLPEADDLRKACSKKIREMIRAQRAKFVDGTEREGYGRELGEAIFDKIEPFADYAFPRVTRTVTR